MMWTDPNLIKTLKENGVAVMPTDTLYGLVGRAQNISTAERIYTIRKRNPEKPCIILIGDISELEKFSINLSEEEKNKLKEYWSFDSTEDFQPRPTSIILDCTDETLQYLHRGTKTLAFRVPAPEALRTLLKEVGPLVAPSANIEGLPPAEDIAKAKEYFGEAVDLYVDGGNISGKASKIIKLNTDGSVNILRD